MPEQDSRTEKRRLGDIGENIACDFLKNRGFEIIEKNYLRKWGEIDIVARKDGMIRFVEVKSVSVFSLPDRDVAHVTLRHAQGKQGAYRAEDNMHPWKLKRLSRVMQTYLLDKKIDSDWQLDLITVKICERDRRARVELMENIII